MSGRARTTPRSRSQRYVRCVLCSSTVTINNFSAHLRSQHPERAGERRTGLYAELDGAPSKALAVVEPTAPALPPLGIDDVVLAVVEQLAEPSGSIPVGLLPAVFAWRAATATFISAVEAQRGAGRG